MIKPTIHLNGDRPETLFNVFRAAHEAVEIAIKAVQATAPNGRNFYPQGPDAYNHASSEHWNRIEPMRKASEELVELAMHCQEFIKE